MWSERGESVDRSVCARTQRPAGAGGAHQKLPFFAAQHTIELSSHAGKPSHCPGAHASIFLGSSWFDRSSLSVAKAAAFAQTPSINSVVGGDGEAMVDSS